MVHQYSVFDEVEDVVEVCQIPDVDNLSPKAKKERRISTDCQKKMLLYSQVLSASSSEQRPLGVKN